MEIRQNPNKPVKIYPHFKDIKRGTPFRMIYDHVNTNEHIYIKSWSAGLRSDEMATRLTDGYTMTVQPDHLVEVVKGYFTVED